MRAKAGLLIGSVTLLALVPACSSSSTPAAAPTSTTSTVPAAVVPEQSPAEVASCVADAKTVEIALQTYEAEKGSYPAPPAPWSAGTYATNYQPLTTATGGGPFLPTPPDTKDYVIAYDSAGHIWITPPGTYGPYNPGQDFATTPDICNAAVN